MKKIKSKEKIVKKKRKGISIIHVVSFCFCVYFCYTFVYQQTKINNYNSQIEMYESDIQSKSELLEYYSKQSEDTQSDEYIESVARDKLGYVKPYEKVYIDANK